ncbi:NUDIX domain-containing protein [Candidatus Saccharibacteria bacterium]|nr:NUDIX domain-containing protein [Candidatus Saccharibacteria bacterium]
MQKELPLTLEEFKTIYSKVPRLNVEVCITGSNGLLLTKRSIEPCIGQWHIPGGTVHFGETIEDAIVRVAENETGLKVMAGEYLGHIEYPDMFKNGYNGWPIGMAYRVKVVGGELRGSNQGEEVQYFTEIPENTLLEQKIFLENHIELLGN